MSLGKMTSGRLAEIIDMDSTVRIYRDRFGGEYVLYREAKKHAQLAIVQRRELLRFILEQIDLYRSQPRTLEDVAHAIDSLRKQGLNLTAIARSLQIDINRIAGPGDVTS